MINQSYSTEWSFREEILLVTHRWPVIVIFCLVGSLVGLIISFVFPSPYRATKELYVGLNVYWAIEDRNASEQVGLQLGNPNDYKNWQMANLNSLIFMDAIISKTLSNLRGLDPYWLGIDQNELAKMLHVYWRNAGKWRLVAENADPRIAAQAVLAWEDVVVNQVHDAVNESQNLMVLDSQLRSLTLTQAQAISQTVELVQTRDSLKSWLTNASQQNTNLPTQETDRTLLIYLFDRAHLDTSGQRLLDALPAPEAPLRDFITWLDQVLPLLDQEILILQSQNVILEDKKNEIAALYANASRDSLGLSANLRVDKITSARPGLTVVRATGLLVLIGGLLGLFAWAILWFTRIGLQTRK